MPEGERYRRFDASLLEVSRWKNGGGTTRELVCWPPQADLDSFAWRVSIADIRRSGPFSHFAGIDRVIMLLQGSGMHLRSTDGNVDHHLICHAQPFAFAGEAPVYCELYAGPSQDFNVMVRRALLTFDVAVFNESSALAPSPHGVLYCARGTWSLRDDTSACVLPAGTGLWWAEHSLQWTLTPLDYAASALERTLIAVSLWPRSA